MKNYINANKEVYAYEDDAPKEFLDAKIKDLGLTPCSDEELDILRRPTLEEERNKKKREITNAFILESLENVEVNSIVFNGGFDSAIKLDAAKRLNETAGHAEVTFYDIDNKPNKLSIEDATTVITTIANKYQQDLAKYQGLKVQLFNAKEIDTIESLSW